MKRRILFFCLSALFCLTLAAAETTPTPLNCHEMAAMMFGAEDGAELLGADGAEAALSDYFAAREAAYRGDVRLLSADEPGMSATVADDNALRAERVREMETRLGLDVLDADVTARIERESAVRNPDGTLTLYVYEWTFYDYDDLADGAGGLDVSGFGTWHILTVAERPDGSYEILSDEYDESDVLGINTLSEEHTQELMERGFSETDFGGAPDESAALLDESASLLAINYYPDYDVEAAVAYSEKYWGGLDGKTYKEGDSESSNANYNPAYTNFNPYGGDCANFTSQSISAGGMPQILTSQKQGSDGWYYKTSSDRSATWTSSTSLRTWMANNRGHLVNLMTDSKTLSGAKDAVFKGSPVFYSTKADGTFQHTVLCVGTNSAGTPIINSHNTNRWHAVWYYYSGSKVIDTVQLTSEKFGGFGGYMKIGEDFYANIINPSLSRYVTNDGAGKVSSRAETKEANQIWRFTLQSDGSYQIVSALKDGSQKTPALAVSGGAWDSRTPICTENDTASPGQRWYLYWDAENAQAGKGAYLLRPQCSDRVMDIKEGSEEEGAGLWLFSRNGTDAQFFTIYETSWVELDTPSLSVQIKGGEGANVTFTWTEISGAASYKINVTQNGASVRNVTVKQNTAFAMKLEPGAYQATLEAFGADKRTSSISAPVSFIVPTSYTITFNPNGGEGETTEQVKIQGVDLTLKEDVPVYQGYDFVSWNTAPEGTGRTYTPGVVYDADADLSLYAQWAPSKFAVTLEPNGGELLEREYIVTYKEPYGELPGYGEVPGPVREGQYEFAGWYTELVEGELVTAETFVELAENHTLYAHWNSTAVYLLPDVRKSGSRYQVITTLHRIPEGTLFACGYLNGQMADVVSGNIQENQTELTLDLEGEFDKILVMALEKDSMRPLCKAESVTRF